MVAYIAHFSLLVISVQMQFLFVGIIPKYFNCVTFSKYLLAKGGKFLRMWVLEDMTVQQDCCENQNITCECQFLQVGS